MRNVKVLLGPLAGSMVAFLLFWVLYSAPDIDPWLVAPVTHFWLVSGTSLLAAGLALLVGVVGARARDARVVYLAAGLAGMAGFFALHGLATPGVLISSWTVAPIASQLAVLAFAGWMMAAAHVQPAEHRGDLLRLLGTWAAAIVLFGAVLMRWPELARLVPVHLVPVKVGVALLMLVMLAVAGLRFLEGYRLARSAIHLVMLHVVGWVMASQLIMLLGEVFRLSWWLYHGLLLGAVATMLITFASQMRAGTLSASLAALLDDDAGRRVAYGFRPEVRALVVATEAKDPYTAGHMQRVATLAVRLGKALGLPPEELRVLAQAGVVHDVGKIEVPDRVLNKHGPLDPGERSLIDAHPVVGERIARALGLHPLELEVIRHHHERWDGHGYPDRLAGEAIPRLARIMAVCDVYDAVTSDRAYRRAWSQEEARTFLKREAGASFDPDLAGAMVRMLALEPERERSTATAAGVLLTGHGARPART